jgi:hypothetical protein
MTTYTKAGCPHSTEPRLTSETEIRASCAAWNQELHAEALRVTPFDVVIVSHSVAGDRQYSSPEAAIEGYRGAWRMFQDRGAQVVVIRDVPRMTAQTTACLEADEGAPDRCARPMAQSVVGPDLMVEAAQGQPGVHVVDLNDEICWDGTCKAAIGGVVVFQDEHHLTRTFSLTLAPALEADLLSLDLF